MKPYLKLNTKSIEKQKKKKIEKKLCAKKRIESLTIDACSPYFEDSETIGLFDPNVVQKV